MPWFLKQNEGKILAKDIVTHHVPLEEALTGYEQFSRKEDDCVKVILQTPFGRGEA